MYLNQLGILAPNIIELSQSWVFPQTFKLINNITNFARVCYFSPTKKIRFINGLKNKFGGCALIKTILKD